jgi:hypothetical protein
VRALIASERPVVRGPDRGRDAELRDHHRQVAVMVTEGREVAGVRVDGAVEAVAPERRFVSLEVRVVRIGVVARERSPGPGAGRQDVVGVDAHEVLARERLG